MKFQIIGGSGFVGSRLIDQLGKNDCFNLDKNQSPFFPKITTIGDIRNKNSIILSKDCETVILLAAEHKDNVKPVSKYYDVNVEGTKNVLDKMDEVGIKKIIFTSSVAVYGLNKNNPNENFPKDPFNHYGKSKLDAEKLIQDWFNKNSNDRSVTIIRPTVIFGERNRGNVYNLLQQISSGRFLMIGRGENKKSISYVGNVVSFISNCIKNNNGFHVYNYVDYPDFSMNMLVKSIENKMNIKISKLKIPYVIGVFLGYFFDLYSFLTKKNTKISSVRIKKFCATTQFDATKAHKIFNSPYTLEEGLNKTLEYEFINPKKDDILFYSE
tara:strand:+ start:150 stop:1127 length:978 start_codon:yes stop_codon:yes gene_type:complete